MLYSKKSQNLSKHLVLFMSLWISWEVLLIWAQLSRPQLGLLCMCWRVSWELSGLSWPHWTTQLHFTWSLLPQPRVTLAETGVRGSWNKQALFRASTPPSMVFCWPGKVAGTVLIQELGKYFPPLMKGVTKSHCKEHGCETSGPLVLHVWQWPVCFSSYYPYYIYTGFCTRTKCWELRKDTD